MADLRGANCTETDLQGANLREAILRLAQVAGRQAVGRRDAVGLTVRQVSEAEVDERTRWPTYLREEMSK